MRKKDTVPDLEEQEECACQPETLTETPDSPTPNEPEQVLIDDALAEAVRQRDEYLNLSQRVQADFDNYRRRNAAVRAEAFDDGAIAFIKTLLPVIDNLERAVLSVQNASETALRDGVQMILTQLTETLEKRGVSPIARLNERFDPTLEDAIAQAPPEEGEPGTVCTILQKGYRMDKTILRHAMVRVVAE